MFCPKNWVVIYPIVPILPVTAARPGSNDRRTRANNSNNKTTNSPQVSGTCIFDFLPQYVCFNLLSESLIAASLTGWGLVEETGWGLLLNVTGTNTNQDSSLEA